MDMDIREVVSLSPLSPAVTNGPPRVTDDRFTDPGGDDDVIAAETAPGLGLGPAPSNNETIP